MNPAHLHLMMTHIPVLGTAFGLGLFLVSLFRGSEESKRISLWVFFLSAVAALPTYLTGRPAGALLLKLMPGMSMDPGDQHAEVAVLALTASLVLGAVALAGLVGFRRRPALPSWFAGLSLTLALVSAATLIWTASLGGKIRHPEVQQKRDSGL
jgi:protein-S-isoprenylcysteine O-methyltransferase Ste14